MKDLWCVYRFHLLLFHTPAHQSPCMLYASPITLLVFDTKQAWT